MADGCCILADILWMNFGSQPFAENSSMLSVSHLKSAGLNNVFLSLPEKQDEMVSANHSCLMAEKNICLCSPKGVLLLLCRVVTQTHHLSPAFFSWSGFFIPSMLLVLRNVFSS